MDILSYKDTLTYRTKGDSICIYSPVRKRWFICSSEELVRQCFVRYLIEDKHYPLSLIAEERMCKIDSRPKRFDLVVFSPQGKAFMLTEFKAPHIPINMGTVLQMSHYQTVLGAPYLCACNGVDSVVLLLPDESQQDSTLISLGEVPCYPFS